MTRRLRSLFSFFALVSACAVACGATNEQWLTYPGGDGPGNGKRIVLIAADQEYRSEESMPMMAKILSTHHGFHCTVLFAVKSLALTACPNCGDGTAVQNLGVIGGGVLIKSDPVGPGMRPPRRSAPVVLPGGIVVVDD